MATPLEVPMRWAPRARNFSAVARSRMPPEAFIERVGAYFLRRETADSVAPPLGWKPVEVLTKSAPAWAAAWQPRAIWGSVRAAVSRMTLTTAGRPAAA